MSHHSSQEEFLSLVHRHQGILHKISFAYSNNKADREDLQQEMVLQLWKSFPNFREQSSFSTWMYRVALNTAINQTKKNSILVNTPEPVDPPAEDSGIGELSEKIQLLYQAIYRLGKIDRAIILLWLEEKSYGEIGSIIGITEKNVSVRLVRIKARLAEIYSKLG